MNTTAGLSDLFAATRGLVVLQRWGLSGAPSGFGVSVWQDSSLRAPAPAKPTASAPPKGRALTHRETDVLLRIAKGFTLGEVAVQLGLSRHTISDHAKALYRKLQVGSRAEAALEAARLGIV